LSNLSPVHDEPKLWHLSAILATQYVFQVPADDPEVDHGEVAGGSSFDLLRAKSKLAGEAVERLALRPFSPAELTAPTSFEELQAAGVAAFDPEGIVVGDDGRGSRRDRLCWLPGFWSRDGAFCQVPAQLVAVPHVWQDNETVLRAPVSTGAAAHLSVEGALWAGLSECIERDAFSVAWYRWLKVADVTDTLRSSGAPRLAQLLAAGDRYLLRSALYQLPCTAPLAVVMAVLTDPTGGGPPVAVAAKAAADPVAAAAGALEEAHQMRAWLRRVAQRFGAATSAGPLDTLTARARLWLTPETAATMDEWLGDVDGAAPTCPAATDLGGLVAAIELDAGPVAAVDLTGRLPTAARRLGWHAVKVVCGALQPLNLTESMEDFAATRIASADRRLGCRAALPAGQRNPRPHPFL
jgi:ribosomal protein S12 methylthiotransferase accessory factor